MVDLVFMMYSFGVKEWSRRKYGNDYPEPEIVYGDTDPVFVKFSRLKDGKFLTGKEICALY